jgi:sigma-B regulation protein RsbU (phosphoserine phosphatase)
MDAHSIDKKMLLKNLMDNMADSIYFKDADSRFIMVNKAVADSMGFPSPEAMVGKSDYDIYLPEDARQMFETEQRVIESRKPVLGLEEKTTWKDGHVSWASTSKMPLVDGSGNVVGTFGISREITERKEAELKAARYAEEIRRIKESLEDDVRMAAELQKTFFPRVYPVLPAGAATEESAVRFHHVYHASGMVSGDFCSILRLSDSACGLLLCDVMGHGVRAALVTALICAMTEEIAVQEHDPGRFLEHLNGLLLPTLRQQDIFLYATACYMVFDTSTGRLRHANAGHPLPLHVHGEDQSVSWLSGVGDQHGPALAIAEDARFRTQETVLAPGDLVLMYTDGLYEIEDADGEEFGESRLLAAAQKHAGKELESLTAALVEDARSFAGETGFNDDICLVGFTCRKLTGGEG